MFFYDNGVPIAGAALASEGTKVLGVPVGGDAFVSEECGKRSLRQILGSLLPLDEESVVISQVPTAGGLGSLIHPTTVICGVGRFLGSGVESYAAWGAVLGGGRLPSLYKYGEDLAAGRLEQSLHSSLHALGTSHNAVVEARRDDHPFPSVGWPELDSELGWGLFAQPKIKLQKDLSAVLNGSE
ncbi:hypothetical protein CYMTET_2906 [Cymbomonas tetramitiformis]|uniref:Uncharacterized protein n=1 Tax=Cymbomonas tetramitiformis TaxID=36881 RepID=A0AAE0LLD6_9CHLO|nr:hypothetical protein CYMTET_2906 [Cymbomonas tetramitiformis]